MFATEILAGLEKRAFAPEDGVPFENPPEEYVKSSCIASSWTQSFTSKQKRVMEAAKKSQLK